ncbi:MAG: hypothetical protein WDN03_05205 [Rhizomicrobium sp.]
MKSPFQHFRLLPVVVVVGLGLLAIKGVDIARAAQGAVAADPDQPDNSGLAPTDTGGAPRPDYASNDDPSASASEVDVLSSLTRRRAELDARERGLNMRENLLSASEGRVDQKIAALKALQTQMQSLLAQRDTAQAAQIAALIKAYGPDGMKASQAASIFNTMPDDVLIPIAKGMKPGDLGTILAKMNPDAAQKLTVKLASLLKLPEAATTAACPVPPQAPPTPGPQADATPPDPGANPPVTLTSPPQQTAAATPPPAASPPAAAPAPPPATPPKPAPRRAAHVTVPPKPAIAPAPPKPTQAAAVTPPSATAPAPTPAAAPATPPATQPALAPTPASAPPTPLTPHS